MPSGSRERTLLIRGVIRGLFSVYPSDWRQLHQSHREPLI